MTLRRGALLFLLLAVAIVLPPYCGTYYTRFATQIAIYGMAALSVDLLLGYGGLITFGLLYVVGRLIYRGETEAMARGDITIAAMVGAIAAACTAQALFWGVLFGGVLAIGMLIVRRSRYATMPYGPGLCLGGLATLFFC